MEGLRGFCRWEKTRMMRSMGTAKVSEGQRRNLGGWCPEVATQIVVALQNLHKFFMILSVLFPQNSTKLNVVYP